jgi:glycosyltransferase involved in cell wall biosynthesis
MNIAHLTASTFLGGPERQMLGLARHLPEEVRTAFLSFSEGGRCRSFLQAARQQGCETVALVNDTPRFRSAVRELAGHLERLGTRVLFCHGYKANLLGRFAARRAGIPAVAVSRGWTGETWKVRLYEQLDRWHLRYMDHVVAVSAAQADKVRKTGLSAEKLSVIHNSIDPDRFTDPDPRYQTKLNRYFRSPRSRIIGAAGRLSPEKGFEVLVAAAAQVLNDDPTIGFVLFGEGAGRARLQQQIADAGLMGLFVVAGFRSDLDRFIPHLDLFVLPSYTEGLPNVVLEASAAGVPVVATAVGGTPEVIDDAVSGWLCPPGDPDALAARLLDALTSEEGLQEVGFQGRQRVLERFTFPRQAAGYLSLLRRLTQPATPAPVATPEELATEPEVLRVETTPVPFLPSEPTCER